MSTKIQALLLKLTLLCVSFDVSYSQELTADRIFETVNNSVVVVLAYDKNSTVFQGSGVVINDEGYIVTNHHVCKDADRIEITHYQKTIKNVETIAQDVEKDILVLKVDEKILLPIKIGNTRGLKQGQRVYAIGSPEGYENSISEGIVSGFRNDPAGVNLIQMTTPITEGSSGGAVVNSKGELIGISTSGQHEGNIYFAIPVEDVINLLGTKNVIAKFNNEVINYYQEGNSAFEKQNYKDAVTYYSKYLEKNERDFNVFYRRGYSQLKLKEYKLAVSDFTKSISLGYEIFDVYFYRGNAYYFFEDYKNAVKDYARSVELSPNHPEAFYNKGFANYKLGNYTEAASDWQRCIELDPKLESELLPKINEIQSKENR
jgi:S1-C subfamily serine protease